MGFLATLVGVVTFAATAGLPWAWLTIAALILLVVSFAWTARDEHAARLVLEGSDQHQAAIERAITDGEALTRMQRHAVIPEAWVEWNDANYERLRDGWGLKVAEGFAEIAQQQPALQARIAAQVAYLQALSKRR